MKKRTKIFTGIGSLVVVVGAIVTTAILVTSSKDDNNNSNNIFDKKTLKEKVQYTPKKIAGVIPKYFELIKNDKYIYSNSIREFIEFKGEEYFKKYNEYIYPLYGIKDDSSFYLDWSVFENKFLVTRKWYSKKIYEIPYMNNHMHRIYKTVIINFQEFFDWARNNEYKERWNTPGKYTRTVPHYDEVEKGYWKTYKNNSFKYKNEDIILESLYPD